MAHYACCSGGEGSLVAPAYGDPLPLGEGSLRRLWNSQRFQEMRRTMVAGGRAAACGAYQASCVPDPGATVGAAWRSETEAQRRNREDALRSYQAGEALVGHYPVQLRLDLDFRCNVDCRMCYLAPRQRHGTGQPIDLALLGGELVEFVRRARLVHLFGGEPTISPQYPLLLDVARQARGARLCITTNGSTLSDRVVPHLDVMQQVCVSVHAATPGTFRAIRAGGDWDRLLADLGALSEACRGRTDLVLHNVIQAPNAAEMPAMVELGRSLGANMVRFVEVFGPLEGEVDPEELRRSARAALARARALSQSAYFQLPSIGWSGAYNWWGKAQRTPPP